MLKTIINFIFHLQINRFSLPNYNDLNYTLTIELWYFPEIYYLPPFKERTHSLKIYYTLASSMQFIPHKRIN